MPVLRDAPLQAAGAYDQVDGGARNNALHLGAPGRREVIEMKHAPDWRNVHHTMTFWIGVVLCLAAIVIYLWSDDLSWRPMSSGR